MRKKNTNKDFIKKCYAQALIKIMHTKHLSKISVSEICKVAGFGRTTYYRYFTNDLEELILFISKIAWEEKVAEGQTQKEDLGRIFLEHVYNHKDFFKLLSEQNLEHLIFKALYYIFKQKEESGDSITYGKSFFLGAYFGVIYEWLKGDCVDTPETITAKFAKGLQESYEHFKEEGY